MNFPSLQGWPVLLGGEMLLMAINNRESIENAGREVDTGETSLGQAHCSAGTELRARSSAETPRGSSSQAHVGQSRHCSWTCGGRDRHRLSTLSLHSASGRSPCRASVFPSGRGVYKAPVHTDGAFGQLCTCLQGRAGCWREQCL